MFYYYVDDEIQLKLVQPDRDAEMIFQFVDRSRNYLREWLGWVDQTTSAEHIRQFEQHCMRQFANNEGLSTAIIYKGNFVGKISINKIHWNTKTAEIGYYLDEAYQGSGIMTRAAKGILDICFQEYKLDKVEISAAVENYKSRHIPERLGFKQEGIIRQAEWLYDHYVDHVKYGLLASEWLGQE